jgi:hypothetical protein
MSEMLKSSRIMLAPDCYSNPLALKSMREAAVFKQLLGAIFVCSVLHSATAEESPKEACWEIVSGTKDAAPYTALLLNKCTGNTWLLIRTGLADKQGKPTDSWIWRWSPINAEQQEAILTPSPGQLVMPNR